QEEIKFAISMAQDSHALYYNKKAMPHPDFKVNDMVWLNRKFIKTQRPSSKLDHQRLGPFKILEKIGTRAYKLELPTTMAQIHPVFHVSLLEKDIPNDIEGRVTPPPLPILVNNEEEYEVEEILNSRIRNNQLQYLIHWKGYSIADRSWTPAEDINSRRLLAKFHTDYPKKPGMQEFKLRYPDTPLPYTEDSGTLPYKGRYCHDPSLSYKNDVNIY